MAGQGKNEVARTRIRTRQNVPFWGCTFCLVLEKLEF
jgi:hypothetical protein